MPLSQLVVLSQAVAAEMGLPPDRKGMIVVASAWAVAAGDVYGREQVDGDCLEGVSAPEHFGAETGPWVEQTGSSAAEPPSEVREIARVVQT